MALEGFSLQGFSAPQVPEGVAECEGLPREKWVTKAIFLHKSDGVPIGKGMCQSISSDLVVDCHGPLGDDHVAVQVVETFDETLIPFEWMFSLRAWHIREAYYNGASLHDHEQRSIYNNALKESARTKRKGNSRPYDFHTRKEAAECVTRADARLTPESINAVASKACCPMTCVQLYPRGKIATLRKQLYQGKDWAFKRHVQLDVHRQIHVNALGNRVVTLDGIDVCPRAWYLIHGIWKSTFHRHAKEVENGARADDHGNTGSKKTRTHTVQATAALRCLLENTADQMPHKSTTLNSREKVVSMQLPPSFKWKETLPQLNAANTSMGLQTVSQSGLSLIRKNSFPEYSTKKPEDNFARCGS